MHIYELSKSDFYTDKIENGRTIFINYFIDLYKNKTPEALQIKLNKNEYLIDIFSRTVQDLKTQDNLYALLAYLEKKPIGFCTFGKLENETTILIRTLPIDPTYKAIEFDWRKRCIDYILGRFPLTQRIIVMVRKANEHHQMLCLKAGFEKDDSVFDDSIHIHSTYNFEYYYGYSLVMSQ